MSSIYGEAATKRIKRPLIAIQRRAQPLSDFRVQHRINFNILLAESRQEQG